MAKQIAGVLALGVGLAPLAACSGDGTGPDPASAVDSIVLSLDSANVILGDTVRVTAVAKDASGTPVPGVVLVWSSTNPSVATVSSDGLVTGLKFGVAEIEVEAAGARPQAAGAWVQASLGTAPPKKGLCAPVAQAS